MEPPYWPWAVFLFLVGKIAVRMLQTGGKGIASVRSWLPLQRPLNFQGGCNSHASSNCITLHFHTFSFSCCISFWK